MSAAPELFEIVTYDTLLGRVIGTAGPMGMPDIRRTLAIWSGHKVETYLRVARRCYRDRTENGRA